MQCVSDLAKLRDCVIGRVQTLRQIAAPIVPPLAHAEKRALAFVTIELDNLIIVALRQYTKSCLLGTRTAAGQRVFASVSPSTPEQAAALIFSSLNPSGYAKAKNPAVVDEKDEIVFRDPKRAEKVLTDYSASNLANLQLALSLNAVVFDEVKLCRHFFSHRMRSTVEAVSTLSANLGVIGFDDTEHFIVRGRPSTGVRFVDGWLSDVENFFDLAA
jgi:hypothetical protein